VSVGPILSTNVLPAGLGHHGLMAANGPSFSVGPRSQLNVFVGDGALAYAFGALLPPCMIGVLVSDRIEVNHVGGGRLALRAVGQRQAPSRGPYCEAMPAGQETVGLTKSGLIVCFPGGSFLPAASLQMARRLWARRR